MRQNMKKDMTLHTMAKRLILNGSSQKGTLKAMVRVRSTSSSTITTRRSRRSSFAKRVKC